MLEGSPSAWPGAIVIETAEKLSLPLIGHVPHEVGMRGLQNFEAQHFTGIPYLRQVRPPVGWDIRNEDILSMSASDKSEALALAKQRNISFTPTLINFRMRLSASDLDRFPPPKSARYLPIFWEKGWDFVAGHPESVIDIENQLAAFPQMLALTRSAQKQGIDILVGTDTLMPWVIPGDALLGELQILSQVFESNALAILAATRTNGNHIDKGNIGVIKVGARADLLVLRNDPIVNLDAIADWDFLIADGRLYSRPMIDGWLAEYQAHFHAPFYEWVMDKLIGIIASRYGSVAEAK